MAVQELAIITIMKLRIIITTTVITIVMTIMMKITVMITTMLEGPAP